MPVTHTIPAAKLPPPPTPFDDGALWPLLQALARRASRGSPVLHGAVALDQHGELCVGAHDDGWFAVDASAEGAWRPTAPFGDAARFTPMDDAARQLLDVYAPLCVGQSSAELVLAHLGQSLDGRLATVTGSSRFVTGPEDLRHTHRLRALFDAVVVGAQTACVDDPQLTTRLVPGRHPTRIVLDPHGRLDPGLKVLNDGRAPTLILTSNSAAYARARLASHVDVVEVRCPEGQLCLPEILDHLRMRGLCRIFIEGGGVTVSRFLQAGLLQRLHVVVAPMILGSGTPALQLEPIERIADAITVRCRRFLLGSDVLFDCDLRARG